MSNVIQGRPTDAQEIERLKAKVVECNVVFELMATVHVNGLGEVVMVEIPASQLRCRPDDPTGDFIMANRDTIGAAIVLGSAGAVPEEYKRKIKVGQ